MHFFKLSHLLQRRMNVSSENVSWHLPISTFFTFEVSLHTWATALDQERHVSLLTTNIFTHFFGTVSTFVFLLSFMFMISNLKWTYSPFYVPIYLFSFFFLALIYRATLLHLKPL
jgi:hypothetical protein